MQLYERLAFWLTHLGMFCFWASLTCHSCSIQHIAVIWFTPLATRYCEFYRYCFEPEVYSVVFRIFTDLFSGPAGAISPLCVSFELSDLSPRYLSCWFTLTLSMSSLKTIFIVQEFTIAGWKCVLFFATDAHYNVMYFFVVFFVLKISIPTPPGNSWKLKFGGHWTVLEFTCGLN